jgi:predicted AAA+ superfamily ATPase
MWQPSLQLHTIEINGRPLSIGGNLWQFLHAYCAMHARELFKLDDEHDHALWVDTLSINQDDNREKAHQIRQMGEIYKEAATVLIWLDVLACPTKKTVAEIYALTNAAPTPEEQDAAFRVSISDEFALWLAKSRLEFTQNTTQKSGMLAHVLSLSEMPY